MSPKPFYMGKGNTSLLRPIQNLAASSGNRKLLCDIQFKEDISAEEVNRLTNTLYELANSLQGACVKFLASYNASSTHALYEMDYASYNMLQSIAPQNIACVINNIKSINEK